MLQQIFSLEGFLEYEGRRECPTLGGANPNQVTHCPGKT